MTGIYKITAPDGKVYIGQSSRLEIREYEHLVKQSFLNELVKSSFEKFGAKNHVFEIIEECDGKDLDERERYYQDFYNAIGDNGLNCKLTKTSDKRQVLRDETKSRIRKTCQNDIRLKTPPNSIIVLNTQTGIYYDSISDAARSTHLSQGSVSLYLLGKTHLNKTDFIYADVSADRVALVEENVKHMRSLKRKPKYIAREKKGKIIFDTSSGLFFKSITEAAFAYNMKKTTLHAMVSGQNRNKTSLIYA